MLTEREARRKRDKCKPAGRTQLGWVSLGGQTSSHLGRIPAGNFSVHSEGDHGQFGTTVRAGLRLFGRGGKGDEPGLPALLQLLRLRDSRVVEQVEVKLLAARTDAL